MESDPNQRPKHGSGYKHMHHAEHSIDPNTGGLPNVASIVVGAASAIYGIIRYYKNRIMNHID